MRDREGRKKTIEGIETRAGLTIKYYAYNYTCILMCPILDFLLQGNGAPELGSGIVLLDIIITLQIIQNKFYCTVSVVSGGLIWFSYPISLYITDTWQL